MLLVSVDEERDVLRKGLQRRRGMLLAIQTWHLLGSRRHDKRGTHLNFHASPLMPAKRRMRCNLLKLVAALVFENGAMRCFPSNIDMCKLFGLLDELRAAFDTAMGRDTLNRSRKLHLRTANCWKAGRQQKLLNRRCPSFYSLPHFIHLS